MPCTHHDGQEEVLELVPEAQGVGAEQGKITLYQLGHGNEKKKKKVTWGFQRPLLAPPACLPLSFTPAPIFLTPTP